MKTAVIRSSWMDGYGYRLDTKPYVGGALQTKVLLEALPLRKDKLGYVCSAILNIGRIKRNWVDSLDDGIPFLSGTDIQKADLSQLSLISSRAVKENPSLIVKKGMTLITRSGTIGRMAFCRGEMDGMACTEDVLRVVPEPSKIPAGYLYAFLSSKFGVPLVASGTYGAIIQHLEPEHIADIDVPRLDPAKEQEIHELVEEAAGLRSEAAKAKQEAIELFCNRCGIKRLRPIHQYRSPKLGVANSRGLESRMDSTYYYAPSADAEASFQQAIEKHDGKCIGAIADVFIPTIFKREYAEDPDFGVPYITGADLFNVCPESELFLQTKVAHKHHLILKKGMILIHEAGSRHGLIGRCAVAHKSIEGWACTNNMVRVCPHQIEDSGYLFAVLSSDTGIRLLKREAAGSAIPHLDERRVRDISIPWPEKTIRKSVSQIMDLSIKSYNRANDLESNSVNLLINALEHG